MNPKGGGGEMIYIEYLQSTGTQYIDTGLTFNNINDVKFKINATAASTTVSGKWSVFGANRSGNEILLWWKGTNAHYINGTKVTKTAISYNTDYTIDFNLTNGAGSLTIDGVLIGSSTKNSPDWKCFLFAGSDSANTPNYLGKMKIYYCQIYDSSNNLARDYVPVRIGTVGYLYDRQNDVLYGNLGTGDFTLGNDITI